MGDDREVADALVGSHGLKYGTAGRTPGRTSVYRTGREVSSPRLGSEIRMPGSDFRTVGTDFRTVGSDSRTLGTDFPMLGSDFPALGTDFPASGSRFRKTVIRATPVRMTAAARAGRLAPAVVLSGDGFVPTRAVPGGSAGPRTGWRGCGSWDRTESWRRRSSR